MKRALVSAVIASLTLAGCDAPKSESANDVIAAVPSIAATMPTTVADPAATAKLRTFVGRDTNHDQFVSSAESAAAAAKIFDAIDTDKDGAVTSSELTAARIALGLDKLPGSEELIAAADQDSDGQLTLTEWIAAEAISFRAADRNGDGKLSPDEWRQHYRFLGSGPQDLPPKG